MYAVTNQFLDCGKKTRVAMLVDDNQPSLRGVL